ncbi:MAG: DUF2975 domain-containing protein [Oscillospiraceae bacterium]|nr:DUF2975 domain-containing protein [Oscillospiraceae bacterium]
MPVSTTKITLWVNRVIAVVLCGLLFAMPALITWFSAIRPLAHSASVALIVAFYCCAVFVFWALWELDGLLRAILRREIFIRANVRRIRIIRWCCFAVALICWPAAFFYPPLVFMVVIMGFLSLVITVLGKVMDAAVEIREENDLTV